MQFLEEEIAQVTSTVWEAVLGIGLVRRLGLPRAPDRAVSGLVKFSGAWEGACVIECSDAFARRAAGTMFGVDPSAASVADTQDAIGELANMTGGNVKALLPEPCRLSLPTVVQGRDYGAGVTGTELVTVVAFDCDGGPVVVRLLKKSRTGKAAMTSSSHAPTLHRREFSRVPVHLRAELTVAGAPLADGVLEQVSLNGGFFRGAVLPAPGARCDVRLHLEGTEITLQVQGHVVRHAPGGCALQFDEVVGPDSLEHLRNLILYNSQNPAQVEQEFNDHLGLRRDA